MKSFVEHANNSMGGLGNLVEHVDISNKPVEQVEGSNN